MARETILADKPANGAASADFSQFEPKKSPVATASRPPSMMTLGKGKETLDVTMGGTLDEDKGVDNDRKGQQESAVSDVEMGNSTKVTKESVPQAPSEPVSMPAPATELDVPRPATSSGWLGSWLTRQPLLPSTTQDKEVSTEASSQESKSPEQPPIREQQSAQLVKPTTEAPLQEAPKTITAPTANTSWFGLWSTAAPSTITDTPKEQVPVKLKDADQDTVMEDAPPPTQPVAGSSWAFWSTEAPKKTGEPSAKSEDKGKLAVAGEPSQTNPEPAKIYTMKEDKKPKSSKRGRPHSVELDETARKATQLDPASSKNTPSQSPAPGKSSSPNLLIPSVRATYKLMENPSILQQIARLLLHGQQEPVKHVFLVKDPPKIKKALAVGIHGLFPAPLIRTIIGQPTGTSIKFANHAAAAIRRWTDKNGSVDCEIEKVALEGEGKIADRVDNLWKLLLNWIDHVRRADFILVACHSQGVPVAVMLVAKLVEFGVVSTGRIGICAMGKSFQNAILFLLMSLLAGVSLGPFPDYKSKLFSGSAGELFEFADPESSVSKRYEDALRVAVKYGVRITYCGSIDDQLVSMEVGTTQNFLPYNHLPKYSPPFSPLSATLIFTEPCLWTAAYTLQTCKLDSPYLVYRYANYS